VQDKTKFEEINNEDIAQPIMAKEKSISYCIRTYLKCYDQNLVKSMIPTGSQPGKLYGLIKVH